MNKLLVVLSFMYLFSASDTIAQTSFPLYEVIPNSKPSVNKEKTEVDGILRISHVSVPSLTRYDPQPGKTTGRTAVIIVPGGGYGILAAGHEGSDIARALNEWGIVAFVLKYRLPDDDIMVDKAIGPLQDAQRAVQVVRQNATQWGIDSHRIGIIGFSAGGHLASTASTHFKKPVIDNPGKISLRPDFSILIYPVISFTDSLTHSGSRTNLIGKKPSDSLVWNYSNELQVDPQTPPAFLVHAKDDDVVKYENSVHYYEALLKNKIPAEIHLPDGGGHGFGMNNPTSSEKWMDQLKGWLKKNHFL